MAPVGDDQQVGERRRRTRSPLIVREDVVSAALALLDEGGYGHLSMRNLCRKLGVSLPTVYAAARSKESVVELAGARGLDRWVRTFADGNGTLAAAAAAMASSPWLFELVRLEPDLARSTLDHLSDEGLAAAAALRPSEDSVPAPVPGRRTAHLDSALLVWMALELAHRLLDTSVVRGTAQAAAVAGSVLTAVAPWAPVG